MARIGAPRVFFNVIGTFQAARMLDDAQAQMTVLNSIFMDGLGGLEDAGISLAEQMQAVVDATVPLSAEIEKASIEFQKFLDVASDQEGITKEIMDVGTAFGFTATQSLDAGARMAQLSGIFGSDVIPQATEMALAFGLIGDMSPEDAMQRLINLQQQTNFIFEETERSAFNLLTTEQKRLQVEREMADVINQLNSVEDKSAATLGKITRVMNEFASQARLTGESIAFMAAMSATLIEAGEEQGKAGRALRMIYARLGADTNGAATALRNLGVATHDADGNLRPLSQILGDLDPKYKKMGASQKQQIAQQVAGNLHYVRFLKLAEGYDRAIELNAEATARSGRVFTDAGEATGFLADMMESNSNQMNEARANLERVNAEIGDKLIPGQVRATQHQIQFNQAILDALNFFPQLGGAIGEVFAFQQKMSTTFQPFFSFNLNLKAAIVSMQTMIMIQRALNGVQLQAGASAVDRTTKARIQRDVEKSMMSEKLTDLREELMMYENLEIQDNKRITNVRRYGRVSSDVNLRNNALLERERLAKENGITLGKREFHNLDISKSKRKELSTVLETQMLAQKELTFSIKETIAAIKEEIIAEERAELEKKEAVGTNKSVTGSVKERIAAEAALEGQLETSTTTQVALSMQSMKYAGILMGVDMAVMLLGDTFNKVFGTDFNFAQISLGLTTLQMGFMAKESFQSMRAVAAMGDEINKTGEVALDSAIHLGKVGENIDDVGKSAVITSGKLLRYSIITAIVGLIAFQAAKHFNLFGLGAKDAGSELDDLNDKLEETAVATKEIDLVSAMDMSGMGSMQDALDEFAGAREEMFFGFKAGNVTGDLVKQIQVAGVENFVQNTEVIQTNNFNGMTTQEVATEILDEIERGGKSRNIVFA
tara:strand:+ start:700 stop:3363 length:2664 start_codon:yes stop_codon:yes gene_type:complete